MEVKAAKSGAILNGSLQLIDGFLTGDIHVSLEYSVSISVYVCFDKTAQELCTITEGDNAIYEEVSEFYLKYKSSATLEIAIFRGDDLWSASLEQL